MLTHTRKWGRWIGLTLLIICLSSQVWAKIPKNVLVIGDNQSNFKTFDPHVCYESPTSAFAMNLYAQLVHIGWKDGAFTIEPDVAVKWEKAADNKTWTFHLRKGMLFANGDPLTADDVVFSLQRVVKTKKSPSWLLTDTFGLELDSAKAIDKHTVQLKTNGAPDNVVLTNLGGLVGSIVNKKELMKHEVDGDLGMSWLNTHSAGAGPFVLKEWKRNDRLVMVANKHYWKGVAPLKMVIFKDVPEPAERYLLLQKGDIDVAFDLTPEQANELKGKPAFQLVTTPAQAMEYVGMNVKFKPFSDPKVRQAVKWAIDYEAMIRDVRGGFALNNQQFLSKGYFAYRENNPYAMNLEKAKALLKESSYPNGFEIELVTNTTAIRRAEAVVVQANLAKIGIKANINIMQTAQMYQKFRKQGIDMIVAGWGNDYPDADALANPFANHRVKQLAWRLVWLDDHAADLTEAAGKEGNPDKRRALYHQLTEYWLKNSPFAMMHQRIVYWVVNKDVKNAEQAFSGAYVRFVLYHLSK